MVGNLVRKLSFVSVRRYRALVNRLLEGDWDRRVLIPLSTICTILKQCWIKRDRLRRRRLGKAFWQARNTRFLDHWTCRSCYHVRDRHWSSHLLFEHWYSRRWLLLIDIPVRDSSLHMLLRRGSFFGLSIRLPRMRPWDRRLADLHGIFIAMFIVYTPALYTRKSH